MDENNVNTQVDETTEVDESTENTTTDTSKEVESEKKNTPNKEEKTFTQEEVNAMMRKDRLKTEKRMKAMYEKNSESKKLEDMTESEKKDAELERLRKENEQYKSEKVYNEMLTVVQKSLSDANISVAFASYLVDEDAETTKANVDEFTKIWNKAIEKAVNSRLAGKKPSSNSANRPVTKLTLEDVQKMSVQEIQANWDEVQKLYQKHS